VVVFTLLIFETNLICGIIEFVKFIVCMSENS